MKKSKMRDLNKRLDDKKYDTEINISKINYDGDGFCGVTSKHYPRINDVKPSVKTNFVPNDDIEINAKTNYDGDGFCGFTSKNYPKINDVKPSVKTNLIPNYDAKINDVNPLEKTDYDGGISSIACFAASPLIVSIPLLKTIPKVDAKPEAKKNDTTIDIAGKIDFDLNDSFNGTLEYRLDASDLLNIVMNDGAEINAKTNYDDGLFDGFIPNYDAKINDVNPLEKTDYDGGISSIACFAASPLIVSIPLLKTIPKVDAKLEAEKNNTAIDIAGKVGFDSNDSFNGTLTECRPDATSDLPNIVMIDFDALNRTLTECRPDASNLPNIVMIDNADTPITDFIVM